MSQLAKYNSNKTLVETWFSRFWGNPADLSVIDDLLADEVVVDYPKRSMLKGRDQVRQFMQHFRAAYPDLHFWPVGELIAEGDYVIGRWDGLATHTGAAFDDPVVGVPQANSGLKLRFTGGTIRFHIVNGKIIEERAREQALMVIPSLDFRYQCR
ncbi:ester cyclase [Neptunicella sp. SCSIO 80796]|uniref:ester cyclase n=1 Tax=Neptunicella plasticusilytica TaxID=3117012 RepID=UPI003A4DD67A